MKQIVMNEVVSSQIQSVGYDIETETLYIQFKNGKIYSYKEVEAHVYQEMMNSESLGKYFNSTIRNFHEHKQTDYVKTDGLITIQS